MSSIDQLIEDGLARIGKEAEFRKWAAQWFPDIGIGYRNYKGEVARWQDPLEVWAFRARGMAGNRWEVASAMLSNELPCPQPPSESWQDWMACGATPYHWIIAGCAAIEMQRKAKP